MLDFCFSLKPYCFYLRATLLHLNSAPFCGVLMPLKHTNNNFFRLFIRAMPLIIAALMIAAQMLVTFHSVAHANKNTFAASEERADTQDATNGVFASRSISDARTEFWNALFGHAADGSDNAAACVAWDAAFAASALIDNTEQLSATITYSAATLPSATQFVALADLHRLALARAPPRG
jgi:hypothetical protein